MFVLLELKKSMRILKENGLFIVVTLTCFLLYILRFEHGHITIDLSSHLNYFRFQADAFLQGHLNLGDTPSREDLVQYNHLYYIYWPPVPALVYMPLVSVFGNQLPDAFINSLFATLNVWSIMKIISIVNRHYNCSLKTQHVAMLGLFWGLGTVHFYMAREGTVWYVSQIMAQSFLLLAIYCFMAIQKKYTRLLIAGFFFACAAYTRNHFVLTLPFFIAIEWSKEAKFNVKKFVFQNWIFILPFLCFSLANAWYNYARFGNYFENGLKYHLMSDFFSNVFKKFGYFSLHYFPHNLYTEVFHWPTLTSVFPFINRDPEGFGFMWGSPFYFLIIPALFLWFKNKNDKHEIARFAMVKGSMLSAFLMAVIIFSIMGTGWVQFCARYTLDFQFFLVLILVLMWPFVSKIKLIKPIALILILLSVIIQSIGAQYLI